MVLRISLLVLCSGALNKKEFRAAVAALGYDAPRKVIDGVFDVMDEDKSGWIEFEEFKKSLSETGSKAATKGLRIEQGKGATKGVADRTDIAGTGEERFSVGMRQNAMERDVADADEDGKLDFMEARLPLSIWGASGYALPATDVLCLPHQPRHVPGSTPV